MGDEEKIIEEMVEEAPEKTKEEKPVEEPKTEEPAEEPAVIDIPIEEPKEEAKSEPVKDEAEEKPAPAEEPKEEKVEEKPAEKAEEKTPEPEAKKEEKPKAKPKSEAKKEEKPKEEKKEPEAKEEKQKPASEGEAAPEAAKPRGPKKAIGLPPERILLFGKYNMAEVVVHDPGLAKYLNLDPIIVAHTGAKHANRSFAKTKMHIIERLVNNMMRTEKYTGKKTKSYKVVKNAFEIIEKRTKSHPVQVFIDAIENSAPREEVTRLRYGGISVPKAVDTSSSRRLDLAFRNITKGAVKSSYKSAKSIDMCLANEIMLAAKKDMNSFAVSKKEEVERVAASAR